MQTSVLHGMGEAANQAYYAAKGLRKLGVDAASARWVNSDFFFPADFDFHVDKGKKYLFPWYGLKMLGFFLYSLARFNTYHFHCGHSLLACDLDLPFLRLLRKKYYFEYHGSELRQGSGFSKGNPYAELLPEYAENKSIEKRACKQLRGACGAIVHDAEMALYVPKGYPVFFVPLRIDVESFIPVYPSENEGKRPLVVHAPSHRGVKGSEYVISAFNELKGEIDFDYQLVENTSLEEAYQLYAEADIIVDQLLIGTYGVFALEAMALGKPVMTYLRDDLVDTFPPELPIVGTSKETFKEDLRALLSDAHRRRGVGLRSREYVENYHDYRKVAVLLKDLYEIGIGCITAQEAFAKVKSALL